MIGKKLLSNSLVYFFASIFVNASNILLLPIYTRFLNPYDYGIIASVSIFSLIITSFVGLGLNGAVNRFYFELEEPAKFKSFLFSNVMVQLSFAGLFVLIILLNNGLFLNNFFKNVPYDPYLKYGMIIGFMSVIPTIPLSLLHAKGKAFQYRLITISTFLLTTTCMFYFVVFNHEGAIGAIKSQLISTTLVAISCLIFLYKQSILMLNLTYVKEALFYGIPLMFYALFGLVNDISSKYFIERFSSLDNLGIFNLSQQIASIPLVLLSAINMAWLPIFYSEAKKSIDSNVYALFGKYLFIAMCSVSLIIALFSMELISVISTKNFHESAIYIPILVLGMVFLNSYWVLFSNSLSFTKDTVYLPLITFISLCLSIPGNFYLIPKFGLLGASISIILTNVLLNFAAFIIFKIKTKFVYDYKGMNLSFILAIIIFCISNMLHFESVIFNIGAKFILFLMYLSLLSALKILSVKDVMTFANSLLQKNKWKN